MKFSFFPVPTTDQYIVHIRVHSYKQQKSWLQSKLESEKMNLTRYTLQGYLSVSDTLGPENGRRFEAQRR